MKIPPVGTKKIVLGLLLVSLVVRVVFVLASPQLAPDTGIYEALAVNIQEGRGYTIDGETPHITRPPLYVFFLAGIYSVFGHSNLVAVRLLQALIDSITVILIYSLGKTISGRESVGVIAGLMACFYPELVAPTAFVLTETLAVFLLTMCIWLFLEGMKRSRIVLGLVSGVVLGLATLCRPVTLALPVFMLPVLFLIYRRNRREWPKHWLCLFLGMVITVAPWTVRNHVVFKTFIPVTVGAGSNLWIGSYVPWDGDYNYEDQSDWIEIRGELNEIEADKKLREEALKNIAAAPGACALLAVKKFCRFWFGIPGSKQVLRGKPFLMTLLYVVHGLILVLFLAGLSASRLRGSQERWIPIMVIIYFTVLHSLLFAIPRYRIAIVPLILVFAGTGLERLFSLRQDRKATSEGKR